MKKTAPTSKKKKQARKQAKNSLPQRSEPKAKGTRRDNTLQQYFDDIDRYWYETERPGDSF